MSEAVADILVERDRGVATITLNRPEKLNAFTPEMQLRYVGALRELDDDPAVRVMVVTGAGRGFCSGMDLARLDRVSGRTDYTPPPASVLPTMALELRKPLVAAVNGPVAGIGFAVMLTADVRFIAAGTRVSTTFARLGLVAEYGVSWLLPRVVGTGRALEILMSGRMIEADEALRIGLVHEVVSDGAVLDRALAWAHDVARQCSPRSLAAIKQQVYGDLDRPLGDAVERAIKLMTESFGAPDLGEALAARRDKRDPNFPPL